MSSALFFNLIVISSLTLLSAARSSFADDPPRLGNIADAAGLFNERGYLKSNSFSLDANEIINDFNGNLIYTKRLRYVPVASSGFGCDLKLTYNGSVGHIIKSSHGDGSVGTTVNFNAPLWIVSVNDIAIQTFNFENELISWPATDTTANDSTVAMLVNGYHSSISYDAVSEFGAGFNCGVVTILLGDGNVVELRTKPNQIRQLINNQFFCVPGNYYTYSQSEYSRGWMGTDGYFTLFNADGTKTSFKLYRPEWRTTTVGEPAYIDSLVMLLPVKFFDSYGNNTSVSYDSLENDKRIPGRPWCLYAAGWEFDWSSFGMLDIGCGEWRILYESEYGAIFPTSNHSRASITKITDAKGLSDSFEYQNCERIGENVKSDIFAIVVPDGVDTSYSVKSAGRFVVHPARMYKWIKRDSAIHSYAYYSDERTKWPSPGSSYDSRTVKYNQNCLSGGADDFPCVKSYLSDLTKSTFDTIGRDPYFTNILVAKTRLFIETGIANVLSRDSLILDWNDVNGSIGTEDTLNSLRYAGDTTIQFAPSSGYHKLESKYVYFPEKGTFSKLSRVRSWQMKLVEQADSESDDGTWVKMRCKSFTWDLGDCLYGGCTGSLLETMLEIEQDGGTSTTETSYSFYGDPANDTTSHLRIVTRIDEWKIQLKEYHSNLALGVTSAESYYNTTLLDSSIRFRNFSPFDTSKVPIARENHSFYGSGDPNGFLGQLKRSTQFVFEDDLLADSLATDFQYLVSPERL